jgi:glycosyltransferase involved in cell wall biosynthesis
MKFALFLGNTGHDSGGPEVYETELVRALAKLETREEFHLLCLFPKAPEIIGVEQENFTYHLLRPQSRVISMSLTLPYMRSRIAPDSLHSTFIPAPLASHRHLMTLVCMSMFERPELYPALIRWRLQTLTSIGIRSSKLILCVSEMVKERAKEHFKLSEERMMVVPLGVHPRFRCRTSEEVAGYLACQQITDPYFLFCGRWEQRKNLLGIIEAFAVFKRETKLSHKLVLTGKRTWIAPQAESLIERLGLQGEVIDHGKTPIAELPLLYAGAEALVYASFYESFGMPIIEAMACGTPVITSNTTAMPEIAGGAALLVDPHSTESIASAMYRVACDRSCTSALRAAGLLRSRSFSWESTAKTTLDAYHRVATEKANIFARI